ncbi:MAG: hypothetical protein RIQ81_2111 [Pseudomonadota bacterium]|jgi:cholesterol oxidase
MTDRRSDDSVFDFAIVGSGFGGSVAALRLSEKGYRVIVLEQGKWFDDRDFARTNRDLRRYLWAPLLKCFGIQNMTFFRNILVLSGTGVGGGSLVYANTLLEPGQTFYRTGSWAGIRDWQGELAPHYAEARRMLGVATNPRLGEQDHVLAEVARDMGKGDTFRPAQVGVYFAAPGQEGKEVPDPYFGGEGPPRRGCIYCGGCMVGCRHGAKNTLVKNYLWFAMRKGAEILAERKVVDVRPLGKDSATKEGYALHTVRSTAWWRKDPQAIIAKNVVFAAGVLGTVDLLLRCKHQTGSLARISDRLGWNVRSNSEALVGVARDDARERPDYAPGVAITSIFHPDEDTHIEPVVYNRGSDLMRLLAAPMVDGGSPFIRAVKAILVMATSPIQLAKLYFSWTWAENSVILLVMQTIDNRMRLRLSRSLGSGFRRAMTTAPQAGVLPVPAYIPVANQVARAYALKLGGAPQSAINEVMLNIPTTAHILGGCSIARDPSEGVVDDHHRIFGYQGLYVCDGSVIPANLGVNPSLTITAMTELAMSRIPVKPPA